MNKMTGLVAANATIGYRFDGPVTALQFSNNSIEEGKVPLYELVMQYVIQSAVGDPRFKPMTEDEVDDVHIEISVMCHVDTPTSPFKKCENTKSISNRRYGPKSGSNSRDSIRGNRPYGP